MPKTRPFSELMDKIMADPIRREQMAAYRLEMEAMLAEAGYRAQPAESDQEAGPTEERKSELEIVTGPDAPNQ